MLDLRVFKGSNGIKVSEVKNFKTIILDVKEESGNVILTAVDGNGCKMDGGILLKINPNGTITLFNCVSKNLGFRLDKWERVVIES